MAEAFWCQRGVPCWGGVWGDPHLSSCGLGRWAGARRGRRGGSSLGGGGHSTGVFPARHHPGLLGQESSTHLEPSCAGSSPDTPSRILGARSRASTCSVSPPSVLLSRDFPCPCLPVPLPGPGPLMPGHSLQHRATPELQTWYPQTFPGAARDTPPP